MGRLTHGAALTAMLVMGAAAPAQAEQLDFSEVTGESDATLTPCVLDSLASVGITSEEMLTDLLASGPRTRDMVANQLRAAEGACGAGASTTFH